MTEREAPFRKIPIPCHQSLLRARYVRGKPYCEETTVTETTEKPTTGSETTEFVIHEALTVIDKALSQMMSRELVSSGEITDVLLDVRTLLTAPVTAAAGV